MKAYLQRNDDTNDEKCSKKGTVLVIDDFFGKSEIGGIGDSNLSKRNNENCPSYQNQHGH